MLFDEQHGTYFHSSFSNFANAAHRIFTRFHVERILIRACVCHVFDPLQHMKCNDRFEVSHALNRRRSDERSIIKTFTADGNLNT